VGSLVRVAFGPVSDKLGGALVTAISGVGLVASSIVVTFFTEPSSKVQFTGFVLAMLGLFFFAGVGNASTFKQIPVIFPPRQAGGVLGWTGAAAAYGPFVFSALIGWVIAAKGAPTWFFYGAAVFYAANVVLNWWYYQRKGCEKPC
jgi:NNP family nitrate/nitrite transporter-like MFS transporter